MSNDYDVLYGLIIRLPDENGAKIYKNIDEITRRLGEAIQKEFEDFYALPFGMELVEPDGKIRIVNRIKFDDEFPKEDDEYVQ